MENLIPKISFKINPGEMKNHSADERDINVTNIFNDCLLFFSIPTTLYKSELCFLLAIATAKGAPTKPSPTMYYSEELRYFFSCH